MVAQKSTQINAWEKLRNRLTDFSILGNQILFGNFNIRTITNNTYR